MDIPVVDSNTARILEREIRTGFELERETEKARQMGAAYEADALRKMQDGKKRIGDFQAVTTMPAREFYRLKHKYGYDELHDRSFHRYLHKKMPELKVANV